MRAATKTRKTTARKSTKAKTVAKPRRTTAGKMASTARRKTKKSSRTR